LSRAFPLQTVVTPAANSDGSALSRYCAA
jgi:hypothetical protein